MCMQCQQNSSLVSRRALGLFAVSCAALLLVPGADAKENEKKAPPKPENLLSPEAALKWEVLEGSIGLVTFDQPNSRANTLNQAVLGEFEKLSSKDTHPESAGFFGKVRELLGGRAGSG